jgi:hypothetical protein
MMLNVKRALICFFVAYLLVTILAISTSLAYENITHAPQATAGVSPLQSPVFLATVPYHVVIMLIIWPVFAGIYFRKRSPEFKQRLTLGVFWMIVAVLVDLICFVLIKSPYSFSFYEFYVLYQPWITLIYIAIFLSPLIHLVFSTRANINKS